ncbi:hypothetical protein BRC99_03310 [Halobacteriales archaeon QS_7_69_60]|nr:MAG: hypothetical protein BRC99_03310 [Halobacteriales archaeon QS_7_69_60]
MRTEPHTIDMNTTRTTLHGKSTSPTDTSPVGGTLAVPLLLFGTLVAFSYPVAALSAVVAVVAGSALLRRGLAALVARSHDHVHELSLPGGTVRFRIAPR